MAKIYDCIVIGAGMAGIGAARTLAEGKVTNYLVVTEDIGGRVPHSEDGHVNYGAYYVRADYAHLLPFVTKKQRVGLASLAMAHSKHSSALLGIELIKHLPSLLRVHRLLRRFFQHYVTARQRSLEFSQKEVLEGDPFLLELWTQPAPELIQHLRLDRWTVNAINRFVWMTAFRDVHDVTAMTMLGCLLPVVSPAWAFELDLERLIEPIFPNIRHDQTVTRVDWDQKSTTWEVHTKNKRRFSARSVIVATPVNVSADFLKLSEPVNQGVSVYMRHVRGRLRTRYQARPLEVFSERNPSIVITTESNGTHLVYSHTKQLSLEEYFTEYEVIAERHWNPAFFLGTHLVESDRGHRLYLVGDSLAPCLEDAYLTGVYAAKQVLAQKDLGLSHFRGNTRSFKGH